MQPRPDATRPPTDAEIARLYQSNPLARALAAAHDQRLRYVARWRQWMAWDGTRWRPDDTGLALDLARDLCRTAADLASGEVPGKLGLRVVERLGAPAAAAAVERLARTDRLLAASPDRFDADADLLNTPAGILDARTGAVTPHRPDAYMTRITAVAPAEPGTHGPASAADRDHPLVETIAQMLGDGTASAPIREALDLVRLDPVAHDPDVADRLAAEYSAILRWAIDGVTAWRRIGLAPPVHARRPAAAEAIARFLGEDTDASPASWVSAGELYTRWQEWTEAAGIEPGSRKSFAQAVAALGFTPARRHGGRRGFAGLRLRGAEAMKDASPSASATREQEAARPSADLPVSLDAPSLALTLPPSPFGLRRVLPSPALRAGEGLASPSVTALSYPRPPQAGEGASAAHPPPSVTEYVATYLMSPVGGP
ncbi:MAG: hypothetical protein L6R19_24865 [Alphaproteobacteria bacterium]|nr:hypothetical protein [Alphaproteobacteria bacterium]